MPYKLNDNDYFYLSTLLDRDISRYRDILREETEEYKKHRIEGVVKLLTDNREACLEMCEQIRKEKFEAGKE
jgi:hypothetical protein